MLSNYYTKTEIDDIDDGLSTLILNTYNTSDKYIYIYIYVYLYIYIYIYMYFTHYYNIVVYLSIQFDLNNKCLKYLHKQTR